MNTSHVSLPARSSFRPLGPLRAMLVAGLLCSTTSLLPAQSTDAGDDVNRRRRGTADDAASAGGRRGANPQEMQDRMLSAMRERLEVTDDEEWKIISDRLTKIMELRRTAGGPGGGGMAFAGRGPGGDNANRVSRVATNPELAALQAALRDKLPEAEIKARLARVREARKQNEARLTQAQEDLRAVLSVRQEAVAVAFGLLP